MLARGQRAVQTRPLLADGLFAAAVGVPLATWTLALIAIDRISPRSLTAWEAVGLGGAVLVMHVAFVARRRWPWAAFAAVSLAALAVALITDMANVPSAVMFPLALYAFCAYGRRPAPLLGPAVGVAGAAIITIRFAVTAHPAQQNVSLIALFGSLLAVVLAAWGFGLFRRVQVAYIAALEERAARAEAEREARARQAVQEERSRIAREMHDIIAHSLAVMVSQAQGGQYAARADPERAAAVLQTIAEAGRQALGDMRALLDVLRPTPAETDGAGWSPQPAPSDLPALLDGVRAAGLAVDYHEIGRPRALSPVAGAALYRLVQEALTNTLKHAGDAAATVRLEWSEQWLIVTVRDDGRGVARGARHLPGHGLVGMRERVEVIGGTVTAGPHPDGGFEVRAALPCRTAMPQGSIT